MLAETVTVAYRRNRIPFDSAVTPALVHVFKIPRCLHFFVNYSTWPIGKVRTFLIQKVPRRIYRVDHNDGLPEQRSVNKVS